MLKCSDLMLNSVDYIVIVDKNFNIVFSARYESQVNDHAQMIRRDEYINKKLTEAYPGIDMEKSTFSQCIRSGEIIVRHNQSIRDFQGKWLCTDNITVPIIRKGKIMGAVELSRDVTTAGFSGEEKSDTSAADGKKYVSSAPHEITFSDILTENTEMKKAVETARLLSALPNPTLIYGETGTGKEMFAQAMITASGIDRSRAVVYNCAAIPENLFESILFGTERGAYTGSERRDGLFKEADGGILFLDEINAMPYAVQGKLLRVLQDGCFRRLGSSREEHVQVKIIAAMNVDPMEAIENRTFRSDLFYRFSSGMIYIPPLRTHLDDLQLYISFFLQQSNRLYGKKVKKAEPALMEFLNAYSWPGNIRELKHLIESMTAAAKSDMLKMEDIPKYVYKQVTEGKKSSAEEVLASPYGKIDFHSSVPVNFKQLMQQREKEILEEALRHADGNISRASRLLELPRSTLCHKIEKHGIKIAKNG